jgi:hypothetical protein
MLHPVAKNPGPYPGVRSSAKRVMSLKISETYVQSLLGQADVPGAVSTLSGFWSPRVDAAKPMFGLSRPDYQCQLVLIHTGEVGNGGHAQFFENRGCDHIEEHVAALEAVSLAGLARVLRDAVEIKTDDDRLHVLDQEAWARQSEVHPALLMFLRQNSDDVLKPERS